MERVTTGQIGQLIERANAQTPQVDFGLMQFILGNLDKIRELMLKTTTFKVIVNYGRSFAEMLAAGKYDWVNDSITHKNFPITGTGTVEKELVLIHPNRVTTSDEVIKMMEEQGLAPASIEDLLALGEDQPELQREFPIICLGSVATLGGRRFVPCLDRWDGGRELNLSWFVDEWDEGCRFLAVRNG